MYHPNVRVERAGPVTTVTLDRPESKNACTGDMWVALGATFRAVAHSGARAVVVTGAGGDFCAGADLGGGGGGGGGGGAAATRHAPTSSTRCGCSATSCSRCTTARYP